MNPSPPPGARLLLGAAVFLAVASTARAGGGPLTPPSPEVLAEARAIVARMADADRGPYARLRWFCRDGSVLPPAPYACRERGGGRQHGEYSADRERLAALGWPVGTVLAALGPDELLDSGRRSQRLRDLVVERYLTEGGDGWVLKKARTYRGRIQVEDEEAAGRNLLIHLLSRPAWVAPNFLLAREAVRALPHHGGVDRTREIRRLSQEVAEQEPSFEALRVRIHSAPGPRDMADVQAWLEGPIGRRATPELRQKVEDLLRELGILYGKERDRLDEAARAIQGPAPHRAWAARLLEVRRVSPRARLPALAALLQASRELVSGSPDGAANLAVLDAALEVEQALLLEAMARLEEPRTRGELLGMAQALLDACRGAGFLSAREVDALAGPLLPLQGAATAPRAGYLESVGGLRRALGWCVGTVRFTFAESLVRFGALEPRALRLVDEVLRGSPALALGRVAARLTEDADALAGRIHRVLGEVTAGAIGLNPGVTAGRLRWVSTAPLAAQAPLLPGDLVVLPETVSELPPVAGILSMAEGNLLSHVQLLARNLGIPNASVTAHLARKLRPFEGEEVLMVVGSRGSVFLELSRDAPPAMVDLVTAPTVQAAEDVRVEAPVPDLATRRFLPLSELHAGLAGRVVGPKAANLGELARLFPGRVEDAIALPFGVFDAGTRGDASSPRARLDAAYAGHRAGTLGEAPLMAEIQEVREAILRTPLAASTRESLRAALRERFGPSGSYGVFVRSDTNVEDLPGFTGAGLNLTLPHLVGEDAILDAVPRVWASVLSTRAIGWRAALLTRPEDVYSSVLLMKSVPADKSGVLVTKDLVTGGEGLTVSVSWGVGGAVDGEAAETLVLRPDGTTWLVAEGKAPYRRALRGQGGVEWVPAEAGQVLTEAEIGLLRELAAEVAARKAPAFDTAGQPMPWDIEFGFVGGKLALFQIRPLVERGQDTADRVVDALTPLNPPDSREVELTWPLAPAAHGADDEAGAP